MMHQPLEDGKLPPFEEKLVKLGHVGHNIRILLRDLNAQRLNPESLRMATVNNYIEQLLDKVPDSDFREEIRQKIKDLMKDVHDNADTQP